MSRRPPSLDYSIWDQLFAVSADSTATLQAQLRECVVSAILGGHCPTDKALPSCRALARYLGIARNTVVLAYECLVEEGYLIPRKGSGYYPNTAIRRSRPSVQAQRTASSGRFDWSKRLDCQPSVQRSIGETPAWHQYAYPFVDECPDPEVVPLAAWRECYRETLSVGGLRQWFTDKVEFDDPLLIEQLRTRVLPRRGIWAAPEEILITVGAQHALYLVANLLINDSVSVGMESPGCPDVRAMLGLRTAKRLDLAVDQAGLVVDHQLDDCDYVHVSPGHQLPTTVSLSATRRQALLDRAVAADIAIIEQDHQSEIHYPDEAIPALKSLDRDGRVIHIGSVSKFLIPGLCLGYVVGPAELIRELRALRRLMLRHPSGNQQRAFALFLARGHYDAQLYRLRRLYQARRQTITEALQDELPDAELLPACSGTACWVAGPASLDTATLQRRALAEGILLESGERYFPGGQSGYFRLGFSALPVERIAPGIAKLARLIQQLLGRQRVSLRLPAQAPAKLHTGSMRSLA